MSAKKPRKVFLNGTSFGSVAEHECPKFATNEEAEKKRWTISNKRSQTLPSPNGTQSKSFSNLNLRISWRTLLRCNSIPLQNLPQLSVVVTSQKHFGFIACSSELRNFSSAEKRFAEIQRLTEKLLRGYLSRFEWEHILPKVTNQKFSETFWETIAVFFTHFFSATKRGYCLPELRVFNPCISIKWFQKAKRFI